MKPLYYTELSTLRRGPAWPGGVTYEEVRRARVAVLAPALDRLDAPALARVQAAIDLMDELLAAAGTSEPHRHVPTHSRKDE
jgi:hypothetical protein